MLNGISTFTFRKITRCWVKHLKNLSSLHVTVGRRYPELERSWSSETLSDFFLSLSLFVLRGFVVNGSLKSLDLKSLYLWYLG